MGCSCSDTSKVDEPVHQIHHLNEENFININGKKNQTIQNNTENFMNIPSSEEMDINLENFNFSKNYQELALDIHNKYRQIHQVDNLKLDDKLNKISSEIAQNMAKSDNYEHFPKIYKNVLLGENIYSFDGSKINNEIINKICTNWYNEIKNYKFDKNNYIKKTGHFTQMVWKNSLYVGFGLSRSKKGKIFIVAVYYPSGNIVGEFKKNVFEPLKDIKLKIFNQ